MESSAAISPVDLILSHSLSLSVFAMEQMSLLRIRVTRFVPHASARDVWGASVTWPLRSARSEFRDWFTKSSQPQVLVESGCDPAKKRGR